jgi:Ca2+-binding EF-hand superfamily protein
MISSVDRDGSGEIEFEEFLEVLKGSSMSPMANFFKELTKGQLIRDADVLPFDLIVSNYRR